MADTTDVEHHPTHPDSVMGKVAQKCKNGLHGYFSMLHLNVFNIQYTLQLTNSNTACD